MLHCVSVERNATEIEDSNIRLGLLTQPVMRRRTRFDPNQAWRQLGKCFSAFVRRHRDGRIFSPRRLEFIARLAIFPFAKWSRPQLGRITARISRGRVTT